MAKWSIAATFIYAVKRPFLGIFVDGLSMDCRVLCSSGQPDYSALVTLLIYSQCMSFNLRCFFWGGVFQVLAHVFPSKSSLFYQLKVTIILWNISSVICCFTFFISFRLGMIFLSLHFSLSFSLLPLFSLSLSFLFSSLILPYLSPLSPLPSPLSLPLSVLFLPFSSI